MKKRIELASKATADFLNNSVFNISGPVKSLAGYLGATGEYTGDCLLQNFIPEGYTQSIFPVNDAEFASKPLVKSKYNPELHLAIGMLRSFDASRNSTDVGGEPYCDFHSETSEHMRGAASLDVYGPLFFVMAKQILPKLSPLIGDLFCNAQTPEDIEKAMATSFTR